MYLDKDGNVIKGLSTKGQLAVGVPGTVSGMEYAREKYGTMKRADADRAGDQAGRTADSSWNKATSTCSRTATEDFKEIRHGEIFLNKGQPFGVGRTAGAVRPWRKPCARSEQRR